MCRYIAVVLNLAGRQSPPNHTLKQKQKKPRKKSHQGRVRNLREKRTGVKAISDKIPPVLPFFGIAVPSPPNPPAPSLKPQNPTHLSLFLSLQDRKERKRQICYWVQDRLGNITSSMRSFSS